MIQISRAGLLSVRVDQWRRLLVDFLDDGQSGPQILVIRGTRRLIISA